MRLSDDEIRAERLFYDRIAGAYDALADASEREARAEGLELLAAGRGEAVLEVGFGTGHALVELARAVGPEGRVSGVDVSPRMAKVSAERLAEADLAGRVELVVQAVPPVPFAGELFDAAFLAFTLELFPDRVQPTVAAELARVLRPDGRLVLVCLARRDGGPNRAERAYEWMHRHFPHIFDCHPIDLEAVLEEGGFAVEERRGMEIWSLSVAAVRAARRDRAPSR